MHILIGLTERRNPLISMPCLYFLSRSSANSFLLDHQLFPPCHFPLEMVKFFIPPQAHLPPQPTFLFTEPFISFTDPNLCPSNLELLRWEIIPQGTSPK